jgi:replicative DNA helicase
VQPPDTKFPPLAVREGAGDADAFRFQPYTLEEARASAHAAGEGLRTGFPQLDQCDLRWQPGKLYAVVGRPSEGKTTLLLEFLMRHAVERAAIDPVQRDLTNQTPVTKRAPAVFVSYEENLHHIYLRLVLREVTRMRLSNVGPKKPVSRPLAEEWLRSGLIRGQGEAAEYRAGLNTASQVIDDLMQRKHLALVDGDADGGEIDRLLHRLAGAGAVAGGPPSLVVIDYYQKIRPARDLRGASRQEQLQDVADRLRRYAKGEPVKGGEADPGQAVPVLVGAQVNRDATAGTQPELHQIREADDLANDAAGVITLYRPTEEEGGELRLKLVKNRDGRRGTTVSLGFHGAGGYVSDAPSIYAPVRSDDSGNGSAAQLSSRERLERTSPRRGQ